MVAILVLSTLNLAPFGVVGVLLVMHADPLAIFLSGLILFVLAGTLVVLFVVVFSQLDGSIGVRTTSRERGVTRHLGVAS